MPAKSVAQRRFFGFIEHDPEKAKAEGVYPKGMTSTTAHDFAATSEKGLPPVVPKKRKYYGQK